MRLEQHQHQTRIMLSLPNKMIAALNEIRRRHLAETDEKLSKSKVVSRIFQEWYEANYGVAFHNGEFKAVRIESGNV